MSDLIAKLDKLLTGENPVADFKLRPAHWAELRPIIEDGLRYRACGFVPSFWITDYDLKRALQDNLDRQVLFSMLVSFRPDAEFKNAVFRSNPVLRLSDKLIDAARKKGSGNAS